MVLVGLETKKAMMIKITMAPKKKAMGFTPPMAFDFIFL
jgi:hypothetical protein